MDGLFAGNANQSIGIRHIRERHAMTENERQSCIQTCTAVVIQAEQEREDYGERAAELYIAGLMKGAKEYAVARMGRRRAYDLFQWTADGIIDGELPK